MLALNLAMVPTGIRRPIDGEEGVLFHVAHDVQLGAGSQPNQIMSGTQMHMATFCGHKSKQWHSQ
jgi:hypothetical protein